MESLFAAKLFRLVCNMYKCVPTQKPSLVLELDSILIKKTQLKTKDTEFFVKGKRKIYIQIRPDAIKFIKKISKHYTIYFFTTEDKTIAKEIINFLAPFVAEKNCLCKDSCLSFKGYMFKDLRKFGKPLQNMVMVETLNGSAVLQPTNCIGINAWDGDNTDNVLMNELYPLLMQLHEKNNIVDVIKNQTGNYSMNLYKY